VKDENETEALRRRLLVWYDENHRVLPWRSNPEPWAVWVSEIMLQQTRVESVIEYFKRFMARYPTPAALAEGSLDELMGYWAGLGYYARARNLHRAAVQLVEEHGGRVPDDPEVFRALSGVGRYTCGAVQSIAFGHVLPVVDGNVIRVLARLDHVRDDPKEAAVKERFWSRAEALLDPVRPGDHNQAMMELGATVCTPRRPKCVICPLESLCVARRETDPESLPIRSPRKPRPILERVAGLSMTPEGKVWLARRPPTGLLGGLWALPSVSGVAPTALRNIGLDFSGTGEVIEHGFTHQIWKVTVYRAQGIPEGSVEFDRYQAFAVDDIRDLGLSGPSLKAMRIMGLSIPHRRGAGPRK